MTVNIERLCRPKHEVAEEVGTRDEGDEKGESKNPRGLSEPLWEHGVLRAVRFPEEESYDEDSTEDEWGKNMGRVPGVLHR